MAAFAYDERGAVLNWFETDFKDTARSTTKTARRDDGKVDYSFSVVNNSGTDFADFSFKVKILNKEDGSELGTARINAGAWGRGERKTFRSVIAIPANVRSISFVMYSDSVEYKVREAGGQSSGIQDLKDLGDMITGADGSGGIFGELFGTGGMPETTVTKTTTTTTPSGTTTTRTTTTTGRDGTVNTTKETTTTQRTSRSRNSGDIGRQTSGGIMDSYTKRKTEKKLNKIRLGKSGLTVVGIVVGIVFGMAAMGALTTSSVEMIPYAVIAVAAFGTSIVNKIVLSRRAKRVRFYESKINPNGNTSIEELAYLSKRPVAKVNDDLQKMIAEGFFDEAYIDINNELLVMTRNGEPIESIEKTIAKNKKAQRKAAREKGVAPESIDDLIIMTDDAEIKDKLKELRAITKKIDKRVEERPELETQVKEFREKYYPEVVRLTDQYNEKIANLGGEPSAQPSDTEINASPNYLQEQAREIKDQLIKLIDSVTEASENLLEKLHEDDIMDISTDIQMLQTTLASKGLLDSDFDIKL